ncbi:Imm41 family immunity protein [Paenibacillus sp. alder61]|uniref:Imm41 family immunity protein n=1 Tax=Paenibacillus sp. alder61 TaxID=2862948 RepID=UPI00296F4960|nr:Imm41 family immunity protein [Paenibacillus sp. alder61]
MKNEAIKVLEANSNGQEGSFIYYLHEEDLFHEASYWELYHAMVDIIEATKREPRLERGISAAIAKVFSFIYRSFMWNYCPNDQYSIQGLPGEEHFPDMVDRLDEVFGAYFHGISVKREAADSEIPKHIGKPATRALAQAGYRELDQLASIRERDLLKLHGVGPKAVRILREALEEKGLSFAPDSSPRKS